MQYAKPYLFIRAFAFLPSLISLIGFSAFRGTLDTSTPLKISAVSNLFNAILDPILMFGMALGLPAMGVPGAALATLAAEIISAASFFYLMLKRKMIRWSKVLTLPSWSKLKPLLQGGAALQLRNVALNLTFLMVTRVTQSLDDTGVAAAAHGESNLICAINKFPKTISYTHLCTFYSSGHSNVSSWWNCPVGTFYCCSNYCSK